MHTRSTLRNVSQGIGAAALLFSQSAQSDEALIQPGTSLGQFPASSISSLQNTIATQLVSDITPDPSLLPSTSFRWLLVKTDSGLALTLPEKYAGNIMHFGQQEKFFVRFDRTTGLPEISFDLQSWQPYTAGTPVNISREEQATLLDISANLQTLNTLQIEEQALSTTLAAQQNELAQVQAELNQLATDFDASLADLTAKNSTLSSKEATKSSLESSIAPEAKLRTDTHPVAANTTLDDTIKNTSIQSALNTYDAYQGGPEAPGTPSFSTISTQNTLNTYQNAPSMMQSMQIQSFSVQSTATSTIPTTADVQSTINVLTTELSRIQTQINTVNSQISAKQNEINTTQNNINSIQQTIDDLNVQINEYTSAYTYWDNEWERLKTKADGIHADIQDTIGYYDGIRQTLMIEGGRNDVPGVGDLEDPDIAAQVDALKTRIGREMITLTNTVPTHTYTDTTTKNLTTINKSFVRVGGEYKYSITFSSTGGYPATIKLNIKLIGDPSYVLFKTYIAYNKTHRDAIVNQTILPLGNKACDYALADKKLETYQEQYSQLVIDWDIAVGDQLYASIDRSKAKNNLYDALELVAQKDQEVAALNAQKSTLTTQKSELETLKNTKATLQSLYTRVKTILDQLQQHIASHGTVTQQIATLIQQANELESYIATLDILIEYAEGDEVDLLNQVGSTSENITTVRNTLSQTEQQLLTLLNAIQNIIPQDTFNRNGTQLTSASDGVKNFFGDGYRTGYFSGSLSGLPAKWITQYEWTKGINDIYPAHGAIQYSINHRAYRTDAQRMNNFAHKELVNSYNADAVTKLNACIALLNQYPAGSNEGIEALFSAIKAQIAKLEASKSTNATIKNHVTSVNDFTKKTLLQGGSYALFEQLVAKNPAFASKIESITATAVQKGNIPAGTDAIIDMRHMITTIMAREFAEKLIFYGTGGINMYASWEQEALSFVNGLGDESIWDKQFDVNADWGIDDHGNKYKFGLYHPGGANNSFYNPHATLFMLYSPDGVNTQVLGPVEVTSGAEADTMKARWKEELLKMKRGDTVKSSGGTYDIFRGFDEKGEYVFWGKYVFGGRLYQTGFQSGDEITVGNYIQKLLEQKLQASQRASSYENQYDEIWAGYEYITALYANSITNYPAIQRAPSIILQSLLETLMYNQILELQRNYSTSAPYLTRIDNLHDRSQLYCSISTFRLEQIKVLPDGPAKDIQLMQTKLIHHEIMKLSILNAQVRAENELGIEKINDIKAGIEFGVSFVPIAGTVVSLVLLFDESKTPDEKAWELAGLLPYGKVGKYAGKVDDVIYLSGKVMKKERLVNTSLDSIFVFGDKAINSTKARLKSLANRWTPTQIDAIKNADPARAGDVQKLFDGGNILDIVEDASGKPVFLTADRFDHLAKEIRRLDSESRLQQFIDKGLVKNSDELIPFIQKVVREGMPGPGRNGSSIIYTKNINGYNVEVPIQNNGFINTIQK